MRSLATILKWAILLPVLAAILLLAVANGQDVTVHLNPFVLDDPVLRAELPLYQLAFVIFVVGVLVGGLVAWTGAARQRRRERERREAALFASRAEPARGAPPRPIESAGFLTGPHS